MSSVQSLQAARTARTAAGGLGVGFAAVAAVATFGNPILSSTILVLSVLFIPVAYLVVRAASVHVRSRMNDKPMWLRADVDDGDSAVSAPVAGALLVSSYFVAFLAVGATPWVVAVLLPTQLAMLTGAWAVGRGTKERYVVAAASVGTLLTAAPLLLSEHPIIYLAVTAAPFIFVSAGWTAESEEKKLAERAAPSNAVLQRARQAALNASFGDEHRVKALAFVARHDEHHHIIRVLDDVLTSGNVRLATEALRLSENRFHRPSIEALKTSRARGEVAARMLGRHRGDEQATTLLLELLDGPRGLRLAAIHSLGRVADLRVIERLRRVQAGGDHKAVYAAVDEAVANIQLRHGRPSDVGALALVDRAAQNGAVSLADDHRGAVSRVD